MRERKKKGEEKKGRSRVFSAVLSLVLPGLGQMVRGRIFAGLLFLFNVILYFAPLFVTQDAQYDVQTPSLLIAVGVWLCSALDAFLYRSSFLVMALLVSLFCFGIGFFGAFFILPMVDI
jgi:Ca2+/Na+ antiporter